MGSNDFRRSDEFTQLVEQRNVFTENDRLKQLKRAEALYQGDFFEGYPYHDFLEEERHKLRSLFLSILQELADFHWKNGEFKAGIEYYEKLIKKDPYNETIYVEYMERLLIKNFPLQAKKVSEQYINFIENELGIPVGEKVQSLFRKYTHSS